VTFTSSALAIDGSRTPASLQRLGNRAAVKESGIIDPGALKVITNASPGNGVRISAGGGVLENRYTSVSTQAYVVENVDVENLNSGTGGWPGASVTARQHLVCVTVADPQYSTTGHAWFTEAMKSALAADPATALDFQYVRPFIIQNVPSGTARVEDLPSPPNFPCYALARLELPANWTTITADMIKDLRSVVNPREKLYEQHVATSSNDILTVAVLNDYEYWPDQSDINVYIPPWATAVYCNGFIEGFQQPSTTNVKAAMRIFCQTAGVGTTASKYADGQSGRKSINLGGKFAIPANIRGTSQHFQIQATAQDSNSQGKLTTDAWTTARIELRFVEEAV
jgi:hypothetical protein